MFPGIRVNQVIASVQCFQHMNSRDILHGIGLKTWVESNGGYSRPCQCQTYLAVINQAPPQLNTLKLNLSLLRNFKR